MYGQREIPSSGCQLHGREYHMHWDGLSVIDLSSQTRSALFDRGWSSRNVNTPLADGIHARGSSIMQVFKYPHGKFNLYFCTLYCVCYPISYSRLRSLYTRWLIPRKAVLLSTTRFPGTPCSTNPHQTSLRNGMSRPQTFLSKTLNAIELHLGAV